MRMASGKVAREGILSALHAMLALQEEHLRAILSGKFDGLERWTFERRKVFESLRHELEVVRGLSLQELSPELQEAVLEGFEKIVLNEEELYAAAERQRQKAKGKIDQLRKGKKALGGYRVQRSGPAPRFLSNRG